MTLITFSKISTETGNIVELIDFDLEAKSKAIEYFKKETEGDGLDKSHEQTRLSNGDLIKETYQATPNKLAMSGRYRYELEIDYL